MPSYIPPYAPIPPPYPLRALLTLAAMGMFGNIKGLAFYQPGEADPYITMNEVPIPSPSGPL